MKWLLNFIWLLSLNNYKAINEFICELIKKNGHQERKLLLMTIQLMKY